MKKLVMTIAIVFCIGTTAFAEWNPGTSWLFFNLFDPEEDVDESNDALFENEVANVLLWDNVVETPSFNTYNGGGGLLGRGRNMYGGVGSGFRTTGSLLNLPWNHGNTEDYDAPLGGGALLLIGFSAAYAMKKRKEK